MREDRNLYKCLNTQSFMDKKRGLIIGGFLIAVFLISLVAASPPYDSAGKAVSATGTFISSFVAEADPFLSSILGTSEGITGKDGVVFSAGEILFAKLLFLIIILSIIWTALSAIDFINNNKLILWVVAIGASILATRWISNTLVPMIILPYSTLGITIAAGLPFLIFFALVEIKFSGRRYKTLRKIAWVLFAVVFVFLWVTRYDTLKGESQQALWIYPITAAVSLAMLWFDGTIQKAISKIKTETATSYRNMEEIYVLEDKIREKIKRFADGGYEGHGGEAQYEKEINQLHKRIASLEGK